MWLSNTDKGIDYLALPNKKRFTLFAKTNTVWLSFPILANMWNHNYYIYILTNHTNTVLYTGVTNNLSRRIFEHKNQLTKGFTSKYNTDKLVYFEHFADINNAIEREKQIKAGSRQKKIHLIEKENKQWIDLYDSIKD
jgi:putative endonuclease